MPIVLLSAWITLMWQAAGASGGPGPGVSLPLAQERAARISNLRYDLEFEIPSSLDEPLAGTETIRFELRGASAPLALDFSQPADRISILKVNGRATAARSADGHVMLPPDLLQEGMNEVQLRFTAGDAPLNRTAEFLYSLFVPARARLAFPCFDQPDLKARWRLTLNVPAGW